MKILFVITGLGVGGAEKQVVDLAERLSELKHDIAIAYMTGEAKVLPSRANVRVVDLGMSKSIGSFFHGYSALRRLVKDFQPDVVHSHMVHANLLARMVRLTTEIPRLVSTAHNTNEGGRLRMLAYRVTDSLADISTNVSQEAVDTFVAQGAVPRGRMLAVSNGIDSQKFSPDYAARELTRSFLGVGSDKIIIAVGRLFKQKDYPNMLKAYAKVSEKIATKLWIVGDGPLRSLLEAMAKDLGIMEKVVFLGVRHDIPDLMRAADLFVLSSAWEGFGLVVAEAMATEKLVVATDSGGVKEVLGDFGFLVPVGDSNALANAIYEALILPNDQTKTLGKQARNRIVQNYSLDKVVDKWVEIYTTGVGR